MKTNRKEIPVFKNEDLLEELKILAHKRDIPYQSLAKIYLAREILMERRALKSS